MTDENQEWLRLNRANWNERAPLHRDSDFYDYESFKAGRTALSSQELDDLLPVSGKSLLHLQCHFGMDSLSWAREGARVTGLDFSSEAIKIARTSNDELGLDATFVEGNVYDAPALLGAQYDIVYTGLGALCWLPDIRGWAQVVADLLNRGGELYLFEFHPVFWVFDETDRHLRYDYFTSEQGHRHTVEGSYADFTAQTEANDTIQWNHNIGDVATALIQAGLRLTDLKEYPMSRCALWPDMKKDEEGFYRLPEEAPSLPLLYKLRAVKG